MSSVNPTPADAVPVEPEPMPAPSPDAGRRVRVSFWNAPFRRRTWSELLFGLINFPIAVFGFCAAITLVSAGVSLAVTVVGVFVLVFAIVFGRWLGALDRAVLNGLLDARIQAPRRFTAKRSGLLGWLGSRLADGVGWRALAHQVLRFPLAVATFCVTVSFWSYALFGMTYWIWYRLTPAQKASDGSMHHGADFGNTYFVDTWPRVLATAGAGLLLLWLAPWIVHAFASLERMLGGVLLRPSASAERVRELVQTRSEAVTSANEQLRRIERDLHDGTQARLVALAMNLGQAKEDLASDDPAAAERIRYLIEGAHQQTKETLTELRDLARGIHPAILDNGLEPALTSLGSRSPIRVTLNFEVAGRPSMTAETITYFAVAELLTNAVKHSAASAISVRVWQRGEQILFMVADNGRGGAVLGGGSGLDGVQRRLATVDGTLEMDSPLGGPTTFTGILPFDA